jgi:hypothetical protein
MTVAYAGIGTLAISGHAVSLTSAWYAKAQATQPKPALSWIHIKAANLIPGVTRLW